MIRPLSALLLSVAGVFACSGPEVVEGTPASALPGEPGPLDGLNRRHARLRERMRRRGYGEEIGLNRTFLLEDRGVAWPLDLAVGKCSTLVALGGGAIRDLSITLFDGEGEIAATDTVQAEGGLLHVCPQADAPARYRPYHLELRTIEGLGAVMLAQFQSLPGQGDGFDGLFEGVLAPRVPFRDVEEHLARSRTALRARGFGLVGSPHVGRISEGGVMRQRARLEAGQCYVVGGRGGAGMLDIDLFLFDEGGVEVARDLGADVEPSIEYCPAQTGRYLVELRAYEGAGAVGLMVLVGPGSGDEPPVEEAADDGTGGGSQDPGLSLGVLVAPLVARGFAAPVFVSRGAAIVPGEVRTHDVVVGPGCALIAGAASHEAMDLDLYLADEAGREVDRDTAVQSTAWVRACRDTATVLRVAVKGYGRDGAYALAVLRAPDGIDNLRALRLEEVTATYRLRGFEERQRFAAALSSGRWRHPVVVPANRCLVVAAAAGDEGRDVDILLRDAVGELSASDTGRAPYGAVSRCAGAAAEQLTVEVEMRRGAGEVEVLVLEAGAPETATPEARSGNAGSGRSVEGEADHAGGG